jgi:CRP/FNR family transcriptional regulator
VKIFKQSEDGRQIILSLVYPGEVFGEHSLLANMRRSTSAEVMETGSIYCIPKAVFHKFSDEHPEVWSLLSELLLAHQKLLLEKIEMITMRSVEERILFYLSQLAEACGLPDENGATLIRLSQSELAGLIGATRETTSSTLNQLARRNLIVLKRRQILLLQREQAAAAAGASGSAPDSDTTTLLN